MNDPNDQTIAETIISIAARFGFESLAEGVEDGRQIDWLRERRCHYMQGFSFAGRCRWANSRAGSRDEANAS